MTKEEEKIQLLNELETAVIKRLKAQAIRLSPAAYSVYYGTPDGEPEYWDNKIEKIKNKLKELAEQSA